MSFDLFNNDECILINGICKGERLSDLSREYVIKSLKFSQEISTEDMVVELLERTLTKIKAITDEEWEKLKLLVPFPVLVEAEDNVDEVPTDKE